MQYIKPCDIIIVSDNVFFIQADREVLRNDSILFSTLEELTKRVFNKVKNIFFVITCNHSSHFFFKNAPGTRRHFSSLTQFRNSYLLNEK